MNTVLTFDNVLTYNKNFKKHGLEVMAVRHGRIQTIQIVGSMALTIVAT